MAFTIESPINTHSCCMKKRKRKKREREGRSINLVARLRKKAAYGVVLAFNRRSADAVVAIAQDLYSQLLVFL
jgi:hypothetical protein